MGDSSRVARDPIQQLPPSDRPSLNLQPLIYAADPKPIHIPMNASSPVVHGTGIGIGTDIGGTGIGTGTGNGNGTGTGTGTGNGNGPHINSHAFPFHSQLSPSPHHEHSTAQPQTTHATTTAPMYPSTFNMGHMAAVLPSHQSQFQQYPVQTSSQQVLPSTYGVQQPVQRYTATQLSFSPPYPHGQYVNAYMPVSPQNFSPSYAPHMYTPYPIYTQQTAQMYPPLFGEHQTYQHTNIHSRGHKSSQVVDSTSFNHGAIPPGHTGPVVERIADMRLLYLEPGRMTSIVSSGQHAVKGTWFEQIPKPNIQLGPPIKPRQSGHALWVGNLPPGATVIDLKDHFSRGATRDIESVKLISKTNCAFVNYRTQAACVAAMNRFVEARFHGTRLACRLRRTTVNNANVSSASEEGIAPKPSVDGSLGDSDERQCVPGISPPKSDKGFAIARFFVLKSLTLHDLEISTQTGLWATQPHNEAALNDAFKTTENVYLIFSANKSGEYFGYARMRSTISSSETAAGSAISMLPTSSIDASADPTLTTEITSIIDVGPKAFPTPPTEWAPKGRIIDDSARGTIFWEADVDDENSDYQSITLNTSVEPTAASPSDQQAAASSSGNLSSRQSSVSEYPLSDEIIGGSSGNTFRVEWISTRRVPFSKSRGLRNAWNANREVKIARDGTELESVVGGKLLQLFGPPSLPHMLQY